MPCKDNLWLAPNKMTKAIRKTRYFYLVIGLMPDHFPIGDDG
jgi:hypothetical protein